MAVSALVVLLVTSLWSTARGSDSAGESDTRITLNLENELVAKALERVASLAGRSLELHGDFPKKRISLRLRAATLEKSLSRILYPSGYISFRSSEGHLVVYVLNAGAGQENGDQNSKLSNPANVLPPNQEEKLPPDDSNDPEITVTAEESDPLPPADVAESDEVLPPGPTETMGVTQGEIEFFAAQKAMIDVEILPPDTEGERGFTEVDLGTAMGNQPVVPPWQDEVLPPPEPGGKGVTLQELRDMESSDPGSLSIQETNMELFPPD